VRIGYYVNNEYSEQYDPENPPNPVDVTKLYRNILADQPRVTRFNIDWTGGNGNSMPITESVMAEGDENQVPNGEDDVVIGGEDDNEEEEDEEDEEDEEGDDEIEVDLEDEEEEGDAEGEGEEGDDAEISGEENGVHVMDINEDSMDVMRMQQHDSLASHRFY
jgi:histone chaperone ASF1